MFIFHFLFCIVLYCFCVEEDNEIHPLTQIIVYTSVHNYSDFEAVCEQHCSCQKQCKTFKVSCAEPSTITKQQTADTRTNGSWILFLRLHIYIYTYMFVVLSLFLAPNSASLSAPSYASGFS